MFVWNIVNEIVRPEQSSNQGKEDEQPESLQPGQRHQNWASEKKRSSGFQTLYLATEHICVVE